MSNLFNNLNPNDNERQQPLEDLSFLEPFGELNEIIQDTPLFWVSGNDPFATYDRNIQSSKPRRNPSQDPDIQDINDEISELCALNSNVPLVQLRNDPMALLNDNRSFRTVLNGQVNKGCRFSNFDNRMVAAAPNACSEDASVEKDTIMLPLDRVRDNTALHIQEQDGVNNQDQMERLTSEVEQNVEDTNMEIEKVEPSPEPLRKNPPTAVRPISSLKYMEIFWTKMVNRMFDILKADKLSSGKVDEAACPQIPDINSKDDHILNQKSLNMVKKDYIRLGGKVRKSSAEIDAAANYLISQFKLKYGCRSCTTFFARNSDYEEHVKSIADTCSK